MNQTATSTRPVLLGRREQFWLEIIRTASSGTDPVPALARAQELRLFFAPNSVSVASHQAAHATR